MSDTTYDSFLDRSVDEYYEDLEEEQEEPEWDDVEDNPYPEDAEYEYD